MRRAGSISSWLVLALVGATSCGDGDPPEEPPPVGIGSVRGPISDWPEQRADGGSVVGGAEPDPSEVQPPPQAEAMDAGVDFGGILPPRDRDAGRPFDPEALDAAGAQDAAVVEADAGDAGVADDGALADAESDTGSDR